jgi:SNF2 family DNA or RNA helicase
MKKDYVAFLNEQSDKPKAVVAQLAITKALRLQQICSGYVKTDAGEEIPLENTPRLSALNELLEDLTPVHKVIVWCVFKNNYRQVEKVCAALGLSYRSITGEVSNKDKSQQVEDFQNDPGVRVMIANQGAGGVGINLTAASYSIFFSRNFSLEADLQAEARNYRGGSEVHEKVTRIDLVAPDTIDALVLDALARKQKISDEILEWKL